jgi:WD40 repeat protein
VANFPILIAKLEGILPDRFNTTKVDNMHKKPVIFLLSLLSISLFGCAQAQADSLTPTIIYLTQTPQPTASLVPSPTPTSIYAALPVISPDNAAQLTEITRLTKGIVSQSIWMPDGKQIILATKAGVYLYDVATGTELRFLDTGASDLSAVSADGKLLATTKGFTISIWEIQTGQKLYDLVQDYQAGKIERLVFSPKGTTLAFENSFNNTEDDPGDRNVQLLDATTGEQVYTLQGRSWPVFSPDGMALVVFFDEKIEFWRPDELTLINSVPSRGGFSFSPASSFIVVGSPKNTTGNGDSADLFDFNKLSKHCTFKQTDYIYIPHWVFSPDEKRLAAPGKPGFAQVWDTTTCQPLYTISGHQGDVELAFSPDGRFLFTYGMMDRTVKVWDANSGKFLRTINGFYGDLGDFSPDGKLLIERQWFSSSIAVWDIDTGKTVRLFDKHMPGGQAVAFSPDGNFLAAGAGLWSIQTGQLQKTFNGIGYVNDIVFSPDGKTIGTAGSMNVFNGSSVNEQAGTQWWNTSTGSTTYEWQTDSADKTWMVAADFSPDGNTFAAYSIWDNILRIWDTATQQIRYTFILVDDQSERGFAFTPDSRAIAIATSGRFIKFWDVYSGQQEHTFLYLPGEPEKVDYLVFSPDGHLLIAAGYKTIWIFNMEKKEVIASLQYEDTYIRSIAISPDGKILAFTSFVGSPENDGIHLLDLSTQQNLVKRTGFSDTMPGLAFSPDGRLLATAGADGTLRLWGIK